MDMSYININDAKPGLIVAEDIFKNTSQPIIKRNTKLNADHLEVLRLFDIRKVKVEKNELKRTSEKAGDKVLPSNVRNRSSNGKTEFEKQYEEAVRGYQKEFLGWRAGASLEVAKIRAIILPLLKEENIQQKYLLSLPRLSNMKDYPYYHAVAVGIFAFAISNKLGVPEGQGLQLGLAGVLADCGMAKIDRFITEKAAFLTTEEFNEVKKHPIFSYQMVQGSPLLRKEMKLAILQHHERLDGNGYPRGEKMEQLSVFSQMIAVADTFHAMTAERLYRAKEPPLKVLEIIDEEAFSKYEPKIVQALYELVCNLSIGSKVQLTNGEKGTVVFIHQDVRMRPVIKLEADDSIIELTKNRHLSIEKILL